MPKNPSTSPKTAKTASKTTNADPVPDASATLSDTQRAVLQRLSEAAAGMSPGEMAAAENIGLSTARKALAALETAGLARRELGVRDGAQKSPDQWFAAEPGAGTGPEPAQDAPQTTATATDTDTDTTADDAVAEQDDAQPEPEGTACEPADSTTGQQAADTADQEPDTPHADAAEELGDGDEPDEGGEDDAGPDERDATDSVQEGAPDADSTGAPNAASPPSDATGAGDNDAPQHAGAAATSPAPVPAEKSGPRLGKGELRMMVEQYLRDHPEQAWTPGQIAKVLGRSAGAVNNAAVKLVEDGTALTFEDAPHRFQIVPASAAKGARRATTTAPEPTA